MEFTNILGKIKPSEKKEKENFFALEIAPDTVKSAIWEVIDGKTEVIKIGTVEEWDEKKEDSFISAADRTISSVSEGISPEPNSIIFGLPNDWVGKDQIEKDKKKILRQVCEKLELKPLGFVVTIEALISFLKKKQGTPPNAIFIRLSETEIYVTLVSLGKVLGSEVVVRSEDLAADVKEGLARFGKVENFPPRMILFNSHADFEEAKQQLISYEWDKELPFLHFPKVESLAVETSIRAIAISGGSEVAKSLGLEIKEEESEKGDKKEDQSQTLEEDIKEKETKSETPPETSTSKEKEREYAEETELSSKDKREVSKKADAIEELGFIEGKDILKAGKTEEIVKKAKEEKAPREIQKEKRGEIKISGLKEEIESQPQFVRGEVEEIKEEQPIDSRKKSALFGNLIDFFKKLKNKLFIGGLSLPGLKKARFPISSFPTVAIFILFIFIGFAIGGFFIYWKLPKAKITIFIKPEVLEKEINLTVSTNSNFPDNDKRIIPGKIQEIEVSGTETIESSGKKLVGDKATGEVTIFNKTDQEKTFEKGTALIGPNSLRFELSESVKVASQSAQIEGITFGKATAKLEAASIGPEYNVASGTEFSFKDFGASSFSGKSDNGLSGGTSREIKAVSKEDMQALLEKLTQKLETQGTQELEKKLPSGMKVFEKGLESKVKSKKFNHDEGDEADKLNLDLSLKISALSFAEEDLQTLLLYVLKDKIPENFELRPTNLNTEIKDVKITEGQANFEVIVKAELLPRYDVDKLLNDLIGKYPEIAKENLSSLPNFAKATVEISPQLPGKLGTLPRLKQNIQVEVRIAEDL